LHQVPYHFKQFRQIDPLTPVIMLTAKDAVADRVRQGRLDVLGGHRPNLLCFSGFGPAPSQGLNSPQGLVDGYRNQLLAGRPAEHAPQLVHLRVDVRPGSVPLEHLCATSLEGQRPEVGRSGQTIKLLKDYKGSLILN
jgi:hypothetical protein